MKILITEEQEKKLFVPRKIDERKIEHEKMINKEIEKIKNSPFGKLSKDSVFEWIQENNLDQKLKLTYKGPALGEVVGSSYNKSTGEVTLYLETNLGLNLGEVGITFKISDIKIGLGIIDPESDDTFYSI